MGKASAPSNPGRTGQAAPAPSLAPIPDGRRGFVRLWMGDIEFRLKWTFTYWPEFAGHGLWNESRPRRRRGFRPFLLADPKKVFFRRAGPPGRVFNFKKKTVRARDEPPTKGVAGGPPQSLARVPSFGPSRRWLPGKFQPCTLIGRCPAFGNIRGREPNDS